MDKDKITMVSPCGVNCGDCPAHLAGENAAMKERMLSLGFKEETLPCPGCRNLKGKCPVIGGECDTYTCFDKKGITFCYECDGFPCDRFIPAVDKVDRAVQNLKVFNLCFIQRQGLEKWLDKASEIKKKYYKGKLVYGKGPVE